MLLELLAALPSSSWLNNQEGRGEERKSFLVLKGHSWDLGLKGTVTAVPWTVTVTLAKKPEPPESWTNSG